MQREDVTIKPAFEERYRALLGERYEEFLKRSLTFLRRSVRINTLKAPRYTILRQLEAQFTVEPVAWCPDGFFVEHAERRDIGNTTLHSLGLIYVQEAASMIPAMVLDPQPGERVLDMCASPGSKTTHIAQLMRNQGTLIANDIRGDRIKSLGLNLQRCGVSNIIVTQGQGQFIKGEFDRILVDAPCSGTGAIRKSLKTLLIWNPTMVSRLAKQQQALLARAYAMLRPGGTLVYSTCSVEPEEDEGVVSHLLKSTDALLVPIKTPAGSSAIMSFGETTYHPDVKGCLRLWPQDHNTEGFFVARLRKPDAS